MTVTAQEKQKLNEAALKIGAVLALAGVVLMLVVGNLLIGAELQFTAFLVGAGFVAIGLVFVFKGGQFGEDFVVKKRLEAYDTARQAQAGEAIQAFQEDERGIVWVWVVAIATWAIMAIAYFALSGVIYMTLDMVETFGADYGADFLANITLTRDVTAWFLIIMTIGIIGWALINSARRETQTYPM